MLTIQADSVWNHVEAGSVFHLADNTAPKQMDCATVTDTGETNKTYSRILRLPCITIPPHTHITSRRTHKIISTLLQL